MARVLSDHSGISLYPKRDRICNFCPYVRLCTSLTFFLWMSLGCMVDVCILFLLKETDKLEYTQFCFSGKILQRTATRIKYLAPGFLGKTK